MKLRNQILLFILFIAIVVTGISLWRDHASAPAPKEQQKQQPASTTKEKPTGHTATPAFNKKLYSINDPSSIWIIANKLRPLNPKDYTPNDLVVPGTPLRLSSSNPEMHLRKVAATALENMFAAAKAQGLNLMLASGYRPYSEQVNLYNYYVKVQGKATADRQSARPGYSEHQTGLAADIEPASRKCEVEQCFAATPEGKWTALNAYKYGFVIRYPEDKESTTGYEYEPWHLRYVGIPLATEMQEQHIATLEEFFGLPPAPDYK